jgi:exodeoxyribonuclease VII large subunit
MEQLSLLSTSILTVKELTGYLHGLLESDGVLRDVWVGGEISNLTRASSGHIYFTLKDQVASIRCAIWRQHAMHLLTALEDGQSIEAHGYVDVYEAGGQLQFYIDTLRPAGEGRLYQEFLRLKPRAYSMPLASGLCLYSLIESGLSHHPPVLLCRIF